MYSISLKMRIRLRVGLFCCDYVKKILIYLHLIFQGCFAGTGKIDKSKKSQNKKSPISHNAALLERNVHVSAHFCCKMVHCGILFWCIVGLVRLVYGKVAPKAVM